jgi:DNA-binding Xre family transcriptional regulator
VEDAPEGRKDLAQSLGVSERTLTNWLTRPDDHPIPLAKTLGLCEILKVPPARLLSSAVEIWERLADPVGAERRLLELEKEIPPGGVKRVIYPLVPPPLMTDTMVQRYATAGAYRRFFPDKERNKMVGNVFEAFLAIRRQRREHFETSNHIIRLLFMRNEFEAWLNGERLFEEVSGPAKIEQIDYLIHALRDLTWNGQPRLVLRMTSAVFRMQYSLFPHPLVLLSGNSGFLFLEEPNILMFLEQEYSAMWEENTFPALRHPEAWLALLEAAKAHLERVPPGRLPPEKCFVVRTALDNLATERRADTEPLADS